MQEEKTYYDAGVDYINAEKKHCENPTWETVQSAFEFGCLFGADKARKDIGKIAVKTEVYRINRVGEPATATIIVPDNNKELWPGDKVQVLVIKQ